MSSFKSSSFFLLITIVFLLFLCLFPLSTEIPMATVAVAHHRNHHNHHGNNRNKISCRNFHTFRPKSQPKKSPNPKIPTFAGDLWAGPAYSNSPPPSSLPIPKFSLCQKRAASLDVPAKSAPVSLTSELKSSADFFVATENLRRILNLDVGN